MSVIRQRKREMEEACTRGDRMKPDNFRGRVVWTNQNSSGAPSAVSIGMTESHMKTIIM